MINLGAALAGGGGKRRDGDFYPTPWEATVALIKSGGLPVCIWEPACGDGAMAEVLKDYEFYVRASDSVDRGYGRQHDFLSPEVGPEEDWLDFPRPEFGIVTNPPFKFAAQFIRKALSITPIVAFLLKSQFWHAANRLPLFEKHPPSRVMPLTWRLDFTGGGNPTMDCTWFVWGVDGAPFKPLPKPTPEMNPVLR